MEEQPKKIGLYGGTFDPVHFGHINLAIELMELRGLEEVWFCPAESNPLKSEKPSASGDHRLNMLKLATQDVPAFKVIDNELKRLSPSYTVDTLKELVEQNPGREFSLLLGDDSVAGFFRWRQPLDIIAMSSVLIASRTGEIDTGRYSGEDQKIFQALQQGMTRTCLMDISATMIRDRLARGLYCGHLIPAKVMDYIKQFRLYSVN